MSNTPLTIPAGAGRAIVETGAQYEKKDFLRNHLDHIVIHRLRNNQPLTTTDLQGLETTLSEIGEEDGQTLFAGLLAHSEAPSHAHFVRSLVGMGLPVRRIRLRRGERRRLERLVNKRTTPQRVVERANIVLCSAEGRSGSAICREVGVSRPTVTQWLDRYEAGGVEELQDRPRSAPPHRVLQAVH